MSQDELMQFRKLMQEKVKKGNGRYEPSLNSKGDLEAVQLGSCEARLCWAVHTWEVVIVFSQLNSTTREPFPLTPQKVGRRDGTKWFFEERGKSDLYSLPNLAQAVLNQLGSFENGSV
jgi:hypothetical protein